MKTACFQTGALRTLVLILGVFAVASISSCASRSHCSSRQHVVKYDFETSPAEYGDDFDWQNRTPGDFLEKLKASHVSYSVVGIHFGWVTRADVPFLMSKLESEVKCAHVVSIKSSHAATSQSSEGREAAFLLEAHRRGIYPPSLSSADFVFDKREIREWFRALNK